MVVKRTLPIAAMEKILKKCGAERVSEGASVALKNVIEDIAENIAVDAIKFAKHAKRKTIKGRDIKLAAK